MSFPILRRAAGLAVAALLLVLPSVAVAADPALVSLSFDGGTTDQAIVRQMLAARGLHATFFVNSAEVGTPGRQSWSDLKALQADGNEIGGGGATGTWLPGITSAQARHEICDDRDALLDHGLAARSFAYPYRDATPEIEQMVAACGYDSGRGGGGFSHDLVPPRDPFFTVTPAATTSASTADELIGRVQETVDDPPGWTTFQIGRVCDACGADALSPGVLATLLDALVARQADGSIAVRTVGDVIGGPLKPAVRLPRSQTTVTLTFDDGNADQYAMKAALAARGLHATFYVNTGNIGRPGYLTWDQLSALQAAGNEVGGHTVDHPDDLTALSPADQRAEVCDDRAALLAHGIAATDFAFPHALHDDAAEAVVRACGYNSARTVGGLQCTSCAYAETLPAQDPYAVRASDDVLSTTPLEQLKHLVTTVEGLGGGWLPIVLHRVANGVGPYGYDPATLNAFLDWLAARRSSGTVVKTMREVVGGSVAASPDRTAPTSTATCSAGPCAEWSAKAQSLTLSATDAGGSGVDAIRYTTDGRDPTASSPAYKAPIAVAKTTTVRYRAYDEAGNAEAVRSVTVRVDTTGPQVAIAAPLVLAVAPRGSAVALRATVSDADSGVASVAFAVDGKVVAQDGAAPWSATWTATGTGFLDSRRITAIATDAAGNTTTSAPVSVLVL